ncbi:MAG: acetyl-CoA carboxylase biotin carboxylase subunit [Candidatus Aminicenantes bacterium]|nr:acetyl-CoA carboxylase biotin carboxylase subunit [Candidatus Aminicenantes bacterium]
MFSKILIANRGEIALRVIRSARELGIRTVAVYSEPDANSLHTMVAHEKICIGPAKASESYLNVPNIISAALVSKSEAIHPGYGFLAENPRFAEICEAEGIAFIGPPAQVMRLLGNKSTARREMKKAKLSVIPGSEDTVSDATEAKKIAQKIGLPVILKASAGGGGKGMRLARTLAEIDEQFPIAQSEAKAAFGDSSLYLEKYFQNARHIEVQVLGDKKGNVTALGERECSVQRRHQKLLEETPSPIVDDKFRKKIIKATQDAAHLINYESLGTFEFLVDERKRFYFMEANTRIQVEHPISEMLYGIDLVKEQLKIAAGEKLSIHCDQKMKGHSMECRINAEDPGTFIPSPGQIDFLVFPGGQGIRVDSAAYKGWKIPPDYDSLVAKIVALAPTRKEVITKMITALEMTTISGIKTNIPLHLSILSHSDFQKGDYDIHFLDQFLSIRGKG